MSPPLSPAALDAACAMLDACRTAGTQIPGLPPEMRPATRQDGYAIQARLEERSQAPLFGWKIAATSIAGQAHIGVDGPLAGRLLAERVIADGGLCPFGANRMRVAEIEFAFRMARTLWPREAPYTGAEVMAAVASLHPAIEIPDSRLTPFEAAGGPQLIADNACAHFFVLGPAASVDWRSMDLAAHAATGRVNGGAAHDGIGRNVLGDPRLALTWLANELSGLAVPLGAGQVVTTGTCLLPMAIAPGDRIDGDFGPLGRVSVTMADA